jgi:type IV secretory pathway VirB10-like protein
VSDRSTPSAADDPSLSPALLGPLPKRGRGVRRLNKVPVLIFVGGVCLVVAAIGYTYRVRLQNAAASVQQADSKPEGASNPEILEGAPTGGEIRPDNAEPPRPATAGPASLNPTATQTAPSETNQPSGDVDSPAGQARKQAWQTYYQQLATLQQAKLSDTTNALKADLAPPGLTGGGTTTGQGVGGLNPQIALAQGSAFQAQTEAASAPPATPGGAGLGFASGGLGIGGYPVLPPAGPDGVGAREKQAFTAQTGDLGADETLAATVRDPISPYLVTAGDVITCVAQGGEDSDTPGQFVGRVSRNIYDSATGRFLLIPQGSKVIGTYDSVVTNGQTRIPTVITRIIFPDSSSIATGAMPAADQADFAGLHDQVDTHLWEKFGNAVLLAGGSAGIQLSQGTGQNTNGYNAQQIGAAALGQQFGELGQEYARSGLAIPNTLRIRNGYSFVIQVTKDMVLRPYVDRRMTGAQPVSLSPVLSPP